MSQTVSAASVVNARNMAGMATSILRGAAQVDFMRGALRGALFFAALFTAGWQLSDCVWGRGIFPTRSSRIRARCRDQVPALTH